MPPWRTRTFTSRSPMAATSNCSIRRSCGAWMTAAFMAFLSGSGSGYNRPRPQQPEPTMTEPFPLIEVSGPPHERGRQYGRQAAARIRKGIAHYTAQLARLSLDRDGIASLVRAYTPLIERFDLTHLEEMRGIAAGADVDLADIVLLNARTEILKLAQ